MIPTSSALLLVKSQSKRLPNKNTLPINGEPMFLINVKKCLNLFDKTYVSSDSDEILSQAKRLGAVPIKRPEELCGDTPNITVYQHAAPRMKGSIIVAVQANSPTIEERLIKTVKILIEEGRDEVMTCHIGGIIYGSIWAITKKKLKTYADPYNQTPDVMVVDNSIDVHYKQDYNEVLEYLKQHGK